MTASMSATLATKQRTPVRPARILLHTFLVVTALARLAPLLWALFGALRPYAVTSIKGCVSWPDKLSFDNFTNAFEQSDMTHYFGNTLLIAVPAVLVTLFLASCVAFYGSGFDFRVNLFLLLVFTAGTLLPQQVIITPLYRLYLLIDLPGITTSGKLDRLRARPGPHPRRLPVRLLRLRARATTCARSRTS
ncbi:hypothetical protein SALBM311S_06021 [Streptomyces alboniger]